MASAEVQAPPVSSSIYAGKFKDRSLNIATAGKVTATGDSAVGCLKPAPRPTSPNVVRKFRATFRPDAGKKRIFYGRANDPHLKWADESTHGISVQPSIVAGSLLNPDPNTLFRQRVVDKKESIYASHVKAPLGQSHDQRPGLPSKLDKYDFTFGIRTEKDGSAGELVSPDKTRPEIEGDYEKGRDLYRQSHLSYIPGEQKTRNYIHPSYQKESKYGVPTPHDNAGKQVKTTLKWLHDERSERIAPIVSKRVDDFRERTQPQLGKVHDPIKDTLKVADDHTFGIMIKPDEYGAGDLIHCRPRGNYRRGKDRQLGLIAAVRQQLKKANYHNFEHLLAAFRHYDRDGKGLISRDDLRRVCFQFNVIIDENCLDHLMQYCDVNGSGQIDFTAFCNLLNWKDKLPTGFEEDHECDEGGEISFKLAYDVPRQDNCDHNHNRCNRSCGCDCFVEFYANIGKNMIPRLAPKAPSAPPSRVVNNHPESPQRRPLSVCKQIDPFKGEHVTSNGMINAVVGGVSTAGYRRYGVPTVRSDLAAPRIKRVSDSKNYGDESDAYGLVNPSVYTTRGVYERDFLLPRSKTEIRDIFLNVGLKLDYDTFDNLYQVAASKHPRGFVSVEGFRNVLDEAQAANLTKSNVL